MITLIIPPSPFLLDEKVFVALGPLYVAAVLERQGHRVRVIDLKGRKDWETEVRAIAAQENRMIGISATTSDFPLSVNILNVIKAVNPAVPVMIGGTHATVAAQDCLMFDKVVVGDGVTGIFAALESSEQIIHSSMQIDLDALPLPARHLIDMSSYHYAINGRSATNVMSQWGCPYRCAFCCGRNIKEYNTVRFRSPQNFVAELDHLNARYGYSAFMLHDDEFNLKKSRTLEICAELRRRDYLFRGFVRTDLFSDEIAHAMAAAGFYQVDVGVESGSARVLQTVMKQTTPEMNAQARSLAKKHGLIFKAFVTVGHPGETREDIEMTKRWLIENQPDAFEVYTITPFPGSLIYDNQEQFDLEFSIDYRRDVASVTRKYGDHRCCVSNSHLSSEEIARLREEVDRDVRTALGMKSTEQLAEEMKKGSA